MSQKIWIDGTLLDESAAKISVYDHGLLYGDGVFEGIRQYSGRVFKKIEHLARLYDSARVIRLEIPYTLPEIDAALEQTIKANELRDSYIRLIVTRGVGTLGVSPLRCARPSVVIIAGTISMYPPEMYQQGMAIITASTVRQHPNALSPKVKSLNYLNNIMAKWEAIDAGVPEAVMLNHQGFICECTGDNIFIVKNGQLLTPSSEAGILMGITRDAVMDLARRAGTPVAEPNLTRYDLYTADECFLTGTGAEVIPVTRIDNRVIGTGQVGPMTKQLMEAFHRMVRAS